MVFVIMQMKNFKVPLFRFYKTIQFCTALSRYFPRSAGNFDLFHAFARTCVSVTTLSYESDGYRQIILREQSLLPMEETLPCNIRNSDAGNSTLDGLSHIFSSTKQTSVIRF